jgi:hypothetical protein
MADANGKPPTDDVVDVVGEQKTLELQSLGVTVDDQFQTTDFKLMNKDVNEGPQLCVEWLQRKSNDGDKNKTCPKMSLTLFLESAAHPEGNVCYTHNDEYVDWFALHAFVGGVRYIEMLPFELVVRGPSKGLRRVLQDKHKLNVDQQLVKLEQDRTVFTGHGNHER